MTSCDPFPALEDLPALDLSVVGGHRGMVGGGARAAAIEAGRAEGFAMGVAEGRLAALAEGRERIVAAAGALDAAAAELSRRDAARLGELGQGVVTLALAIAEAVIGRELDSAIDPGADAIARALELAPDRGALVARLNPRDAETLVETDSLAPGRELAVVADPAVERGGCVLEVGPARIDAQIGAALERVRDELTRLDDDELGALGESMAANPGGGS